MKKMILNVGCGDETYGTHFVDLYPSRPEVIKCDLGKEKLPFPDNFFDEVYSKNVLEHLKNPGFALEEMKRVLKKGGELVLITDNAGYLFHHIDLSRFSNTKACHQENTEYRRRGHPLDKHYSLF
ncbi:MAG: class I SAM-dependent methyltransferase, partial [Candidatus Nanoarchaeia archaeon]